MYLSLDTAFDVGDDCATYTICVYVHICMYAYQAGKGCRSHDGSRVLWLHLIILGHGSSSDKTLFE